MTMDERNVILEAVDILRYLGGNNGMTNLQPKIKRQILKVGNALKQIVENDIQTEKNENMSIGRQFMERYHGKTETKTEVKTESETKTETEQTETDGEKKEDAE